MQCQRQAKAEAQEDCFFHIKTCIEPYGPSKGKNSASSGNLEVGILSSCQPRQHLGFFAHRHRNHFTVFEQQVAAFFFFQPAYIAEINQVRLVYPNKIMPFEQLFEVFEGAGDEYFFASGK